jgi:hypothetical protein
VSLLVFRFVPCSLYASIVPNEGKKTVFGTWESTAYPILSQLQALHDVGTLISGKRVRIVVPTTGADCPQRIAIAGHRHFTSPGSCDRCMAFFPTHSDNPEDHLHRDFSLHTEGDAHIALKSHKAHVDGGIEWAHETTAAKQALTEVKNLCYYSIFSRRSGFDLVYGIYGDVMHLVEGGEYFNTCETFFLPTVHRQKGGLEYTTICSTTPTMVFLIYVFHSSV